jgi:hypothetical protein
MRKYLLHVGVFLFLLAASVGAVRYLHVSSDLIRAVPLIYLLYIVIVLVSTAASRQRPKGTKQ